MSDITYAYPAMLALSADMTAHAGMLHAIGLDVASEQAALSAAWQGDTGMSYQAWQARWNDTLDHLVGAYRAMATTHEANTLSMHARDAVQGAKWVGA